MRKTPNRLIDEKSPYLMQHAYNPVDWYPWCEKAFKRAEELDKPIFLSIGYSTCHWCHVMEYESFEDSAVAELLNDAFVSIKVDREERPDIDNIYMTVCQMMTGNGGWPLTIIMTPDKKPFFAGTYIPKENRFGRIGMIDLIKSVKNVWETKRGEIYNSAKQITDHLQKTNNFSTGSDLNENIIKSAYSSFENSFDKSRGGFGTSPKFPSPHNLMFLLRYAKRHKDSAALNMVETTLQKMSRGGIFDQIGFGFHRYSTDAEWLVPHFEKMLYDQALLSSAYIEAFLATGNDEYKNTAEIIFEYVLRDLTSEHGGFYSAEDADSEGVEGKFYVWTKEDIYSLLSKDDADLISDMFNITSKGNFKNEITKNFDGDNIPHLKKDLSGLASNFRLEQIALENRVNRIREKLFEEREKRIHPHKDKKILTDWNSLMIAALAKGARVSNNPELIAAAEKSVNFIFDTMTTHDGRLLHRSLEGDASIEGFIDDYAFFINALLELYETTFNSKYLLKAVELTEISIRHFWDDEQGGFFFTSDDAEKLLVRSKNIYDGAIPSGNSFMMLNLLRLSRITAEAKYEEYASQIGQTFSSFVNQSPSAVSQLLSAVDFGSGPSKEIIIVGNQNSSETKSVLELINYSFIPNKVVILVDPIQDNSKLFDIADYLKNYSMIENKTTVYICENYVCSAPAVDLTEIEKLLKQ